LFGVRYADANTPYSKSVFSMQAASKLKRRSI
jgi:hypothetical protein